MLKIFTVLKSGGDFSSEHVYRMKEMCDKHIVNTEFQFYCLSDISLDCRTIKLKHAWKAWWSKIELFSHAGPGLYFDLDTIIVNNIDNILTAIRSVSFCGLRDQWHPNTIGSGIMYWVSDMKFIYDKFVKSPDEYIKKYRGDQDYINACVGDKQYIQDHCTDEIVSFKANLDSGKGFDQAKHKIVYFHGPPRPWEQDIIKYR